MKQFAGHLVFVTALLIVAFVAAPALAQPRIDVGVGYQFLHAPEQSYPFGVNVDLSIGLTDSLRVVGEYGTSRDSEPELGVGGELTARHIAGGLRYASDTPSWATYMQLLVGSHRDSFEAEDAIDNVLNFSEDTLMLQPGVGIKVPISDVIGIFGQADFRHIFYENEGENDYRFVVGLRFGR